jgi:hypothetical protein
MAREDEAMLDVVHGTRRVAGAMPEGAPESDQAPVGEVRTVVGQAGLDAERGGSLSMAGGYLTTTRRKPGS